MPERPARCRRDPMRTRRGHLRDVGPRGVHPSPDVLWRRVDRDGGAPASAASSSSSHGAARAPGSGSPRLRQDLSQRRRLRTRPRITLRRVRVHQRPARCQRTRALRRSAQRHPMRTHRPSLVRCDHQLRWLPGLRGVVRPRLVRGSHAIGPPNVGRVAGRSPTSVGSPPRLNIGRRPTSVGSPPNVGRVAGRPTSVGSPPNLGRVAPRLNIGRVVVGSLWYPTAPGGMPHEPSA